MDGHVFDERWDAVGKETVELAGMPGFPVEGPIPMNTGGMLFHEALHRYASGPEGAHYQVAEWPGTREQ